MKLQELLSNLQIVEVSGDLSEEVNGVAYDSRKVKQGDLFICVQGFKVDGHDYVNSAIQNGAKAFIVEKDIDVPKNTVVVKVMNSRIALADISSNYYNRPTNSMDVVGVTGTNGKTTTTHIIKNILEKNGVPSGLIGTISHKILDVEYKSNNTTPESLELQQLFHQMQEHNVHTCVMEVSSHSLEMHRVRGVRFKIGVFTNLTPDHMDFHINIENYRNAKAKLFYQTTHGNIINIDDEYGQMIYDEIRPLDTKVISYAIRKQADYRAENISITSKGTSFTVISPKFKGLLSFSTPGMFSVYNVLAAVAVCTELGYDFEQIKNGIESIKGVPGRFELVDNMGDKTVIVDYAHTPDALENVINTIKEFVVGRIITVFGCGGDRDKSKRPMMGEIAGRLSDICIITSDNPRTESPEDIIKDIENGIKNTNSKYKMIIDRKEAIREAIKISKPEDVILIAGKGHETYQIIGSRVLDFDDRLTAQDILREEQL